jgi:hypothetical protein
MWYNFREIREEKDEKMLQADLDNLQSWSDTWLLKFHPNKCKVMSVGNKSVDKGTKHYHLYNNDGNRNSTISGMSLIYITKSIGPRTLPCGNPLVT